MLTDPFEQLDQALQSGLDISDDQAEFFSALDDTAWPRFVELWEGLESEHRLTLLSRLGEAAEEILRLDFARVYEHALDDTDPTVRELAVRLASEAPTIPLAERYLDLAATDPDEEVRVAALEELSAFTFEAQVEDWPSAEQSRLERFLSTTLHDREADFNIRRAALLSESYLTTDGVVSDIRWAQTQPDLEAVAVEAMGRNCQDMWIPDIQAALRSDEARLQVAAAGASAELEDQRLIPDLLLQLRDPEDEVRLAAVAALGIIGGEDAKDALTDLLQSRDRDVRTAAKDALDELLANDEPLDGL